MRTIGIITVVLIGLLILYYIYLYYSDPLNNVIVVPNPSTQGATQKLKTKFQGVTFQSGATMTGGESLGKIG